MSLQAVKKTPPAKVPRDITCEKMLDNDTWTECLHCHATDMLLPPIPGLLHHYVVCASCMKRLTQPN